MHQKESTNRPAWVSDSMFPFKSRYFPAESGHSMHYVDEGDGEPIVFVHGNPAWSFEFRHLIAGLRPEFRCIAADHVGFGLSSRSQRQADHHPQCHAARLAAFVESLDLRDLTLFVTDWGGPIGLALAAKHPDRVKRIVITNTWCWPVNDDFHFRAFSFFMASPIGQYLIKRRNFFVNGVMPRAVGDKSILTSEIMAHYRNAQPSSDTRLAHAALPGHIIGAGDWLQAIWRERSAFADKPALVLWGLRDIAFRRKELDRWQSELSRCELHEYPECGHFLAEEAPDEVLSKLRAFMHRD